MVECPSCGGDMRFDRKVRMYVCRSCGLMMTRNDLDLLREEKRRKEPGIIDEYLDWWQKRKK